MTRQMADDEVLRPEVVAWRLRWTETDADGRTESTGSITFDHEQGALNRVEEFCAEWPDTATVIEPLVTLDSHNAAVAALQAERDALRAEVDLLWRNYHKRTEALLTYQGQALACSAEVAGAFGVLEARAERAESALEALRGQVAGLVEAAQKFRDAEYARNGTGERLDAFHDARDELDAALLAMKNSGEF